MIEFIEKFLYKGFVDGEYNYELVHILSLIFLLISIVYLSLRYKDKHAKLNKVLNVMSIVILFIYLFRRLINVFLGTNVFEAYWPFYLCNVNTIFLCLYQIFGWKKGKDFFLVTGLIGGLFTFFMPNGIFDDKYITLQVLDSVLSHYVIVVVPLVLFFTKSHILQLKNMYQVYIGLLAVVVNAEIIQVIIFKANHDYLFFDSNLPFTISGVPQFIIISVLAIVLVTLVYVLDYLYINKKQIFKYNYSN